MHSHHHDDVALNVLGCEADILGQYHHQNDFYKLQFFAFHIKISEMLKQFSSLPILFLEQKSVTTRKIYILKDGQ